MVFVWPSTLDDGGDYFDGDFDVDDGGYGDDDVDGDVDDTNILNTALGEGEGDIEGGSDEHVRRRHQDISQAHISALTMVTEFSSCPMLIFCVSDEVDNYIVLLVLVVGHDGDDGVVYEQSERQDASKAWERRSGKNIDVKDTAVPRIRLLKIPGKGDVLLTGDITELGIDSPPVSYNVNKDLFECG